MKYIYSCFYINLQCPDASESLYNCLDEQTEQDAIARCSPLNGDDFAACHDAVSLDSKSNHLIFITRSLEKKMILVEMIIIKKSGLPL